MPALQLTGEGGDWIVMAGVVRAGRRDFEIEGPQFMGAAQAREFQGWLYAFEMIFVPKDRWAVSASLAFDSRDFRMYPARLTKHMEPSRIDVVFSFDYRDRKQLALDLEYGRLPVEARVAAVKPGKAASDAGHLTGNNPETQVFSACLSIQF